MKIGATILNLAFVGALGWTSAPLQAAEAWSPVNMRPMSAMSLDDGNHHILSYFLKGSDSCKLTLIISETSASSTEETTVTKPYRVAAEIASGRSATIDTVGGKALDFLCAPDALSMTVTKTDRLALYSRPQ